MGKRREDKLMLESKNRHQKNISGEKVFHYSIRKYHFGAASVVVAALMFFANGTIQAQMPEVSPATENGMTRAGGVSSDSSGEEGQLSEKTLITEMTDFQPGEGSNAVEAQAQAGETSQGRAGAESKVAASAEDKPTATEQNDKQAEPEQKETESEKVAADRETALADQSKLEGLLKGLSLESMKTLHDQVDAQAKRVQELTAQVEAFQFETKPEMNVESSGDISVKIGHNGATKAQVEYVESTGYFRTIGFTKTNGTWRKDDPIVAPTVTVATGGGSDDLATISIPIGTARFNAQVKARQKDDLTPEFSEDSVTVGPSRNLADTYRNRIHYPRDDEKVVYGENALTGGHFTDDSKTQFATKIRELNSNVFPPGALVMKSDGNDIGNVVKVRFMDRTELTISHDKVARSVAPIITKTKGEKLRDVDRVVSGTAIPSASKVTLQFQDGKAVDITPRDGRWSYTLPEGRYLRQTDAVNQPTHSNTLIKATQTVFDQTSATAETLVAKTRDFAGKVVKQVKDNTILTEFQNYPERLLDYQENGQTAPLPDYLTVTWKKRPDFTTIGKRTATLLVSEKTGSGNQTKTVTEVTVSVTVYPQAEAKYNKFINVLRTPNNLIDGDNPERYIKFTNGNQTVAKPEGVTVSWRQKPSTETANTSQTGIVEVSYTITDANGALTTQSHLVTVNVPVYHATVNGTGVYTTTFGRNFRSSTNAEGNYLTSNFNENVKYTWKSAIAPGYTEYGHNQRSQVADYLGKRKDTIRVFYPDGNNVVDYNDRRSEDHVITFEVKPVKPSLVSSIGKVGQNTVTVNNVNSGTTVVLYDMANPNIPIELGRVDVPNSGNFATLSGVTLRLTSGKTLSKNQKIAARTIYAPTDNNQRTQSEFSDTFTVKESLSADSLHVVKGDTVQGNIKDRIHYNDITKTGLPTNATVTTGQADYTKVGSHNHQVTVNIPGQGTTSLTVPITVYPPASLKSSTYNNKQGTLSHGTIAENYVEFKDGDQVVAKPGSVTVRWQSNAVPRVDAVSAATKGRIEVVYPGGIVKTLEVSLPTYHSTVKKRQYERDIKQSFDSNRASDYVTTNPVVPNGTKYVWKTDGTTNREYGSDTWGELSGDWLGKKVNKVKVYYPKPDGGNAYDESLGEETEELTFITKPAKPTIASSLTGQVGTRSNVTINNVTPGTTLELYDGPNLLGKVDVPKMGPYSKLTAATIIPAKDIPASSNIIVKSIYSPTNQDQRVESDSSDSVASTKITVSAKGTIQTLAGNGTISGLDNLNQVTLAKLLTLSDGSTVAANATGRWERVQDIQKGQAGTRTAKLLVRLPGHTQEQAVAFTITTLALPTVKAVIKEANQNIKDDELSTYVTAPGNAGLAWRGNPANVTADPNIPDIEVRYPTAGTQGIAFSDVTTQYVRPTVYGVQLKTTGTREVVQGGNVVTDARSYLSPAGNTNWPNGMRFSWKNGRVPSSATVGKTVYTVVAAYGNGAPQELRGQSVELPVEFAVKPAAPVATANSDGSVGVTIPDGATKLTLTYTAPNDTNSQNKELVKRGEIWTAQGLQVSNSQDGQSFTVAATNLKPGTEFKAVATSSDDVSSAESNAVRVKEAQLPAPTISQRDDYGIQIELHNKARHAEVAFMDAANALRTLKFDKHQDEWIRTDTVGIGTVVTTGNNVIMAANTAKAGTVVSASQKTALSDFSDAATHTAIGLLNNPTVTANEDTSVTIQAPQDATSLEVTYKPAGSRDETKVTLTKTGTGWNVPEGFEIRNGLPLLKVEKAAAASRVAVKALGDSSESRMVTITVKYARPAEIATSVRQNGQAVLTLPADADRLTLTVPTTDTFVKTIELSKDNSNSWSLPADSAGITKAGNTLVIPANTVQGNHTVSYVATAGSGVAKSAERTGNFQVPTHNAPRTQNVVIAANATPSNQELLTGVTETTKKSIEPKEVQTPILAGTKKEIAVTLTYQDDSIEDVDLTVFSKPTAPRVNDLENRSRVAMPGLLSTARTISGQAMAGAEKVKLTLQNGREKEVPVVADGSWTYTLAADEFLMQTTSSSNSKYSRNQISLAQVKDGVESEMTRIGVVMGRTIVDTPLQAGRDITVRIPHDTTSGYIRIGGTIRNGGVDIGLKKVDDVWLLDTDANKASKLELVSEVDPTNPSMTKVTLKVKNTDDALYTPPFIIGSDRGNVKFRAHYYNGRNIGGVVPMNHDSDLEWILSSEPTNTEPTVSWETGKEVRDGQKIPSPTEEELKDLFKGADAEDDTGLTVGYKASARGKLRVHVFTGRDMANNVEGTSVGAKANGRIAPGNYTLVLSTRDAAGAESNLLERNVVIQSHADYYRGTVKYPINVRKVTYNDTAITNGNFTTAAKISFKDKIQELNRTVLPTSTTYTVGNTNDKAKVAVIGFPDGSTIDVSHIEVAKPTNPTFTATSIDQQDSKLQDIDRVVKGTALHNATSVILQLQTGKNITITRDPSKTPDTLASGQGVLSDNGTWAYRLEDNTYLRQTADTSVIGSTNLSVKVKQTVFTAESDFQKIYVAKERNFEGKMIKAAKGSPELEALKQDASKAINYTEKGQEKTFPGDFKATWKDGVPDFMQVGTRQYTVRLTETNGTGTAPGDRTVTVTVTEAASATLIYTNRDNGETLVNIPQDADEVVFNVPRNDTTVDTIIVKKAEGWTANGITKRDGRWVFPANLVQGSRIVTAVATVGSGDTKSVATPTSITTLAHEVEITKIIKVVGGSNPTNEELFNAVAVNKKQSASLKEGTSYPTTLGNHTLEVLVTYQDQSIEIVRIPYEVKEADKSALETGKDELTAELNKDATTAGKTEASKQAYEEAKQKAQEALDKANEVLNNPNASEADVNDAKAKLAEAKKQLEDAKAGLTDVAKSELSEQLDRTEDKDNSQSPSIPSIPSQSDDNSSIFTPNSISSPAAANANNSRNSYSRTSQKNSSNTDNSVDIKVDKSELRTLVEDLEKRLKELEGVSSETLEEALRILREAQAALANKDLTAQELADLLVKVRKALNSLQGIKPADKSKDASTPENKVESDKGPEKAKETPPYGVFGAAILSLLGVLLFAVARKKSSKLDKLSRELHQLVVELEASDKDKKGLNEAKKLAKEARDFVTSQQKDPQKEAELISKIQTSITKLKEES